MATGTHVRNAKACVRCSAWVTTTAEGPALTRADGSVWPRVRAALVWGLPAIFTLGWLVYVTWSGQWARVTGHWRTGLTMVFGSFVAGSTPQGGGAVAFPVFTKVLEIPASVARTFSLSIQATGMVMASLSILLAGRRIDRRAFTYGVCGGAIGFFFGLYALSDPSALWWPSRISAPYVKVSFTIAIAAMAYIVYLCFVQGAKGTEVIGSWTSQAKATLVGFGIVGGIASALTGSGVDVFLFLFVVLIAGLHPSVGVPTSIVTMAVVSTLGLVMLGLYDGQLSIDLDSAGDVVGVGGTAVDRLDATQFDVFGIWLGAAPIVVWGAPLGSWVASKMSTNRLIGFVAAMAVLEVATTIIFLDALHRDIGLIVFSLVGLAISFVLVRLLGANRHRVMGVARL